MLNLLRKAKVQLMKIDQQKQLKSSGVSAGCRFLTSWPLDLLISNLKMCFIGSGLHLDLAHVFKAQFQRQAGVGLDYMNSYVNANLFPVHIQHFILLAAGAGPREEAKKKVGCNDYFKVHCHLVATS